MNPAETPDLPPDPTARATRDTEAIGSWGLTLRERLWGIGVMLAALLLIVGLVVTFWQPGPPRRVIMSTGAEDGAYHAFGLRYREILARAGVELVLLPSAGAVENLERLRTRKDGVSLTLVQGGLAQPGDEDRIASLGVVAYEPLWVFHRVAGPIDDFTAFRGLRIAGGVPGSGTRRVADRLLAGLGMTGPGVPPVLPLSGLQAAEALERGEVDMVMLVSSPEGAAVQRLLRADKVSLWSWRRADAYVRQFPLVSRADIPEGAFDLLRNLPRRDTTLLALKANLVAEPDIHPVLVDLLLDAAREVHGANGLVQRAREFPAPEATEYRMSPDAERYFKSGPSVLRLYLPYWSVVWIQRLIFFGLPVLAIGIPLLRVMPVAYRWIIRRRIYRWYGELSFIERAVDQGRGQREVQLRRLGAIEDRVNQLRIPASFAGEAYTLRSHVKMVRDRLLAR